MRRPPPVCSSGGSPRSGKRGPRKSPLRHTFMIAVLMFSVALPARPVVVQSTAAGFSVRLESAIKAPPLVVYNALVSQVGHWWNTEHTYSGDAKNLSIEARP